MRSAERRDASHGSVETDLLIVGAGPSGLATAIAAREAGLSFVILDKGPVVSAIERYPLGMTFFSSPEKLEIGAIPFVTSREKPTRSEALTYYRRVADHFQLGVRQYETVEALAADGTTFQAETVQASGERRSYAAGAVVVATGYFDTPNLLDVPGEDLPKVTHYFREAHRYYDQDVLVIGGGNSAVEAALTTWRTGARVTLAHLFDGPDRGVKPWVLPDLHNRLQAGDIQALWCHEVVAIEPTRIRVRDLETGDERWLPNDFVLAMTGFRPDPSLLESLDVPVDRETGIPAHDPATMETAVPGVFIAGVVASGFNANRIFIENGRDHGPLIVQRLLRVDAPTPEE